MKNPHQQPSFKFETNIAKYDVKFHDHIEGEERWVVDIVHAGGKITATYNLPIEWSRTLVFNFLSTLEINEIGHDN